LIRTHIIPCGLPRDRADALNLESGSISTGILVAHWRVLRRKRHWLSEKSGTRWSDRRTDAPMHAHTIDAAQQGFYKACTTTRALRRAGFVEAKFPHWPKKFRTTIWKATGFRRVGDTLVLSNGLGNPKVAIVIPAPRRGPGPTTLSAAGATTRQGNRNGRPRSSSQDALSIKL
jgi:putative transposase